MKANAIPLVLAAITATVTSTDLGINITNLPLKVTLAPDAIDTLVAHGLWAPDPDSFNRGQPNVDNVNVTAENLKFEASGLNIDELVSVSVNNQTAAAVSVDKAVASTDVCSPYPSCCDQCHTCEEACLSVILCLACWIICEGACQGQAYCKNDGCD
ncbi:hypothetical protein VSDG_00254 [Cytospora chrysosperma]|uniref:4Fe-4S ferredoxin-type domain-containing protein n=1 Tax=Cytospora chrysosperma TaxID=252740 RepID=A0A423WP49_CYTCH|nr:hypothetical protein VSDG_00254 [Valsa sordida]